MIDPKDLIATKWDSAEYLETKEDMQAYLQACIEEAGDDTAFIAKALGTIVKAHGVSQLAKDTGLRRESLYSLLSDDVMPNFDTILKVIDALDLSIIITSKTTVI